MVDSRKEKIYHALNGIFDIHPGNREETEKFASVNQDDTVDALIYWIGSFKKSFTEINEGIYIHSMHEEGIDILLIFQKTPKIKIGFQIKAKSDFKKMDKDSKKDEESFKSKVNNQIVASYKHNLYKCYVVFAADMTNKSIKAKVNTAIAEISTNPKLDKYVEVIKPEKISRIYDIYKTKGNPVKEILTEEGKSIDRILEGLQENMTNESQEATFSYNLKKKNLDTSKHPIKISMNYELPRGESYRAYLAYKADRLQEPFFLKAKDKIQISTTNIDTGQESKFEADYIHIFPFIDASGKTSSDILSKIKKPKKVIPDSIFQANYFMMLEAADGLFKSKKFGECLSYCNIILEIYFLDAKTFLLKALCYYSLNDFPNALLEINSAIQLGGDVALFWYYRSMIMYNHDILESLSSIRRAYQLDSLNVYYINEKIILGNIFLRCGHLGHAKKSFKDILQIEHSNLSAKIGLMQVYQRLGYNTDAIILQNEIYEHPDSSKENKEALSKSRMSKGIRLGIDKEFEKAVKYFERILESDPSNNVAKLNIAESYRQMKDYSNARTILKEILKENPLDASVNKILGLVEENDNNLPEAEKAFELSLKQAPCDAFVIKRMIDVLLKQDKINDCEKYVNSGLELDLFDSTFLMYKGFLEYENKRYESSIAYLTKSIEHNKDEAYSYFCLALNKFVLKDYSEAARFLKVSISYNPDYYKMFFEEFSGNVNINKVTEIMQTRLH